MLKRLTFTLIVTLVLCTSVNAQFKIVGPEKETPGNLVVITLTDFKGEDIIVDCIPKNSYWTAGRNLKGEPQVSFATVKQGTYTFIFATNKDKVTIMQTWSVVLGSPTPPPVPVPPVPIPPEPGVETELSKALEPKYMVSPNAGQLTKYIAVFEKLSTNVDGYTQYKQAWDFLVSETKTQLNSDTDLRALRDEVAKYLVSKTGADFTKYDKAVLSAALKDLVIALKIVKARNP